MNEYVAQEDIRVFIIEDHELVRDMMGQLIQKTEGMALCGTAGSAEEALGQFPEVRPEVVLVDLSLPGMDGLALIKLLQEKNPEMVTLAVSAHLEGVYAHRALNAGARGYLMKDELIEVIEAVREVYGGGVHISERLQARLNG